MPFRKLINCFCGSHPLDMSAHVLDHRLEYTRSYGRL